MDRRQLIAGGLATSLMIPARANAKDPVFVGDMHMHSFFGPNVPHLRPMAKSLADGRATLVAWKVVGDGPWIESTPRGFVQKAVPKPGDGWARLQSYVRLIKAHCAEQNLKLVEGPADVDAALSGEPRVVLAVEGANFIEDNLARVQQAYDLGLRHIQIVHYIRNTLGDIQTQEPQSKGLTETGKQVVRECNRLGILVDLAHCAPAVVADALAVSMVPMVWSHGSVTTAGKPDWTMIGWKARQITVETAKTITQNGGVVGLWALSVDVGKTIDGFADRMLELARWLGEDHVAFGTDINGLGPYATLNNYVDVRRVVDVWEKKKVPEARIAKLAIRNYARVLRGALAARSA